MKESHSVAKLIIPFEDGERRVDEARDRGYLSHVLAEIDGTRLYPILFYTIGRLQFELTASSKAGEPFIGESGMIVVEELTLEIMREAVQKLCHQGFFASFIPVTQERLAKASPYDWPP